MVKIIINLSTTFPIGKYHSNKAKQNDNFTKDFKIVKYLTSYRLL